MNNEREELMERARNSAKELEELTRRAEQIMADQKVTIERLEKIEDEDAQTSASLRQRQN